MSYCVVLFVLLFFVLCKGPGWLNELGNRQLDYLTTHTSLSPIRHGFAPGFVYYKKGTLDSQPQVIKFPVACRWFSPGTPTSSTTETGRHDIAEILLKHQILLKHKKKKRKDNSSCVASFYGLSFSDWPFGIRTYSPVMT